MPGGAGGGELPPLPIQASAGRRPGGLGKQGGEKLSGPLACLHLLSPPCWFAWALRSPVSMSAHSSLLTVDGDGGLPAPGAAAGERLWAPQGFLGVTQSWPPAQALPKGWGSAVGGTEGKEGGGETSRAQLGEVLT